MDSPSVFGLVLFEADFSFVARAFLSERWYRCYQWVTPQHTMTPFIPEHLPCVATRIRGVTLFIQLLGSTGGFLALAHPSALTGVAQVFGVVTYFFVALGSLVSVCARGCTGKQSTRFSVEIDSLARSPRTHFHWCVGVNAVLFAAMVLLVSNTEDAEVGDEKKSAFNRIEIAAVDGSVLWGTHAAHCAVAYVMHRTCQPGSVRVDVSGVYTPLLDETSVEDVSCEGMSI